MWPVRWQRYQRTPNREAKQRAAISRAYYAVLHRARIYLRDKDYHRYIPKDRTLHNFVYAKCKDHPDPDYKRVARVYTDSMNYAARLIMKTPLLQ